MATHAVQHKAYILCRASILQPRQACTGRAFRLPVRLMEAAQAHSTRWWTSACRAGTLQSSGAAELGVQALIPSFGPSFCWPVQHNWFSSKCLSNRHRRTSAQSLHACEPICHKPQCSRHQETLLVHRGVLNSLSTAGHSVGTATAGQGLRCPCAMPWSTHSLPLLLHLCDHGYQLAHASPGAACPPGAQSLCWEVPVESMW